MLQAGTTDVDAVRQAMIGQRVRNLTGSWAEMLPNHHLTKPVLIGEIKADGQFNVVWKTPKPVPGEAWASKYLAEDKGKVANWEFPWVCESCKAPTYKMYE